MYNFERENMLKSHALQIRLENSYKTIITHFLAWKRSSNHYAHCLNIDRKQNCIGVKNLTAGITSYASKRWIGLTPILSFSFLNGESIAFSSFGFDLLQISCREFKFVELTCNVTFIYGHWFAVAGMVSFASHSCLDIWSRFCIAPNLLNTPPVSPSRKLRKWNKPSPVLPRSDHLTVPVTEYSRKPSRKLSILIFLILSTTLFKMSGVTGETNLFVLEEHILIIWVHVLQCSARFEVQSDTALSMFSCVLKSALVKFFQNGSTFNHICP